MRKIASITLVLLVLAATDLAAQLDFCGTVMDPETRKAYFSRNTDHLKNIGVSGKGAGGNATTLYVPVVYHLVGDNVGNGYYSLEDWAEVNCELNAKYAGSDLVFYLKELPRYINSSSLYNGGSINARQITNLYNIADAMNIYVVDDPNGACGFSNYPGNWFTQDVDREGGMFVAINCMDPGSTTLGHEIGHYMNLPHTFDGWEGIDYDANYNQFNFPPNSLPVFGSPVVERVDGSNCTFAGDGFCDTDVDYLSDRWSCPRSTNMYDPSGTSFLTPGTNYMSYSNDGCQTHFSSEQQAEMYNTMTTSNFRASVPTLTQPDTSIISPPVYQFPVDEEDISADFALLLWERGGLATHFHVQVSRTASFGLLLTDTLVADTFLRVPDLTDNQLYYYRVKPLTLSNTCWGWGPTNFFTTSEISLSVNVVGTQCPGANDGAVQITASGGVSPYTFQWSDGRTKDQEDSLPAGIYSITVSDLLGTESKVNFVVDGPAPADVDFQVGQFGGLQANLANGIPPYTITWSDGTNGAFNPSPEGEPNGDAFITITDGVGCTYKEDLNLQTYFPTTSIAPGELAARIRLYPNPASLGQELVVDHSALGQSALARVFNTSGQLLDVRVEQGGRAELRIQTANLAKGVYLLQLQGGEQRVVRRFAVY